jgi:hypothetical protein
MRMQGIASKIQRLVPALGLLPIPLQPFSVLAHTVSSGRYRGVNVDRWGHSVNDDVEAFAGFRRHEITRDQIVLFLATWNGCLPPAFRSRSRCLQIVSGTSST